MPGLSTVQYNLNHSSDGYEFFVTANTLDTNLQIGHAVSYLKDINYKNSTATICFPGEEHFVWVEPEFRNRGIGTAMIRHTGEILKDIFRGTVKKTLAYAVTSEQSLPYYQKVFGAKLLPDTGVNGQLRQIRFEI